MILEMFTLTGIAFGTGYFTRNYLLHLNEIFYQENECCQCHLKVHLPKNKFWEYKHKCGVHENRYENETLIKIKKFDVDESPIESEKISAEGKTLC